MAVLIDGRKLGNSILGDVSERAVALAARTGIVPTLAAVLVGGDGASVSYVRQKERACERTGLRSVTLMLPASTSEAELLERIDALNRDSAIHGIIAQLPLPAGIDVEKVVSAVSPAKDVDGFHPVNLGLLMRNAGGLVPCTPAAVCHILDGLGVSLAGKRAVVVGRSLVVGRPLSCLLLRRDLTVTVCHTLTEDLAGEVSRADVVVAAAGRAALVRGEWVKPGAIVIDVGTNPTPAGLVGDVEFAAAAERAGYITPVPGGVGPLTVAMLLRNVVKAASTSF
ncbi:MAG: bifunctional 5,10-methylenetetrahydrofolate dehydrogenase/5,10-methenyltetrahydrofolate cyclohydrolase [Deltaproteobacteria bacterium]|nr:bifunctional 5,10-methylenetetrahydrofolate dehydrogenase/5,10-methenyltetrahydrofolate cyclohydrolase [Deltaproteobacteria bacterium]